MRPRAPRLIGFGRRNWTHVPVLGADDPWEADPLDRAVSGAAKMRATRRKWCWRKLSYSSNLYIDYISHLR